MAQKVITTLVDDITGTPIADGSGSTVRFAFDGGKYEIDLSDENTDKLRSAFATYTAAARRVGARGSAARSSAPRPGSNADDLAKIREWANANGHEVSARGRIAQVVRDAYDAAH